MTSDITSTIRSLIRTIRDTAKTLLFASSSSSLRRRPSRRAVTTTAPPSLSPPPLSPPPLMRTYENLARTLDLVIRLIRAYRRRLLNASHSIFEHTGDRDDHTLSYDHHSSANGLMIRCTVVAVDYARDLTAQIVRSLVHENKRRWDSSTFVAARPNAILSFFAYIHKKIVTRAIWLVCQRTMESAVRRNDDTLVRRNDIGDGSPTLSCHVCNRSFDKTFHYLQHIRVHYRLNLYLCPHCGESFVQQNGLNYHVNHCCSLATAAVNRASISNVSPPPPSPRTNSVTVNGSREDCPHYELCDSCGRFFENGKCLRNHVLRTHAVRNADLGVNRTQQEYIRKILYDKDEGWRK